ncbi:dihydroorotate dehydrogenase electron transfer subunit [bacterium]|nr:dihydroorotate dehydrogenase electron transfer subunit [candidate division CSSED10-310 bacterium]
MQYKIISHDQISPAYYHLSFYAPSLVETAKPGQFLMIRVLSDSFDPLLRRPISIMNVTPDGSLEILYKTVGKGTYLLTRLMSGMNIDVLGPLGTGFAIPNEPKNVFIVGGGIGIPPLYFLTRRLASNNIHDIFVFNGARSKGDLLLVDRFKTLTPHIFLATEDGSAGVKGLVTDTFEQVLRERSQTNIVVYACGPKSMLKSCASIALKYTGDIQLSLENQMGCGIGACFGCSIDTTMGLKCICKDGPVFQADTVTNWLST